MFIEITSVEKNIPDEKVGINLNSIHAFYGVPENWHTENTWIGSEKVNSILVPSYEELVPVLVSETYEEIKAKINQAMHAKEHSNAAFTYTETIEKECPQLHFSNDELKYLSAFIDENYFDEGSTVKKIAYKINSFLNNQENKS